MISFFFHKAEWWIRNGEQILHNGALEMVNQ
jgi:hypothetical protein